MMTLLKRAFQFAENGAGADITILQVRRSIALEGEGLLPGKLVIGHPVLAQLHVFHRTNAHCLGDSGFFVIC